MTDVPRPGSTPQQTPAAHAHRSAGTGGPIWVGWVLFVGIMLLGAGLINVLQGLVALLDDGFYLVPPTDLAIDVNYTVWGWALLILGVLLVVAGCGVGLGYGWARAVGVVVAAVNALVNLAFVTAYPFWTVIAVSFDVLTIYALVVHGAEAKTLRTGRQSTPNS